MPGVKALRKIQLGRETTAGTATTAGTLWRGIGTMLDNRNIHFVEEDVGVISGLDRGYVSKISGELEMDSVEATFEQLHHIFEGGIKAVGTGVVDTGGSGRIYTYQFPTTSQNTIKTYTLEGGDDQQAERMAYCFVREFNLKGEGGAALMMNPVWEGQEVSNHAFSPGIAIPSVEEILFTNGSLYADPVGSPFGTTIMTATLRGINLKCTTGWQGYYTTDGKLYFSSIKCVQPEMTCEVTFEHNANAVSEKAYYRNATSRLLRLKFEGSVFATAGATYSKKTFIMDLAGKWEKWAKLDDTDGNDIVNATFRCRYNATAGQFAKFILVDTLATVPG